MRQNNNQARFFLRSRRTRSTTTTTMKRASSTPEKIITLLVRSENSRQVPTDQSHAWPLRGRSMHVVLPLQMSNARAHAHRDIAAAQACPEINQVQRQHQQHQQRMRRTVFTGSHALFPSHRKATTNTTGTVCLCPRVTTQAQTNLHAKLPPPLFRGMSLRFTRQRGHSVHPTTPSLVLSSLPPLGCCYCCCAPEAKTLSKTP